MPVEIVMPHLSDSMEEGTIVQWLVAEGDTVAEGAALVEVETDKATVVYDAEQDGTVLSITAQAGDNVAVGAVIALIGEAGEVLAAPAVVAPVTTAVGGASEGTVAETNAGDGSGDGEGPEIADDTPASERRERAFGRAVAIASAPEPPSSKRIRASPLARRVAAAFGVDLGTLVGSGPQGRVIRSDVERSLAVAEGRVPVSSSVDDGPGPEAGDARGTVARDSLSRLQRTIARRMVLARTTIPDFELRCEVDMSAAVALREQMRGITEHPPSFNDFIVKASALALREFPRVNGAFHEETFERFARVNVGIAVAADDALVVPTIFDADTRTLSQIAAAARELAAKVRDGSVSPAELAGGTFSISNLGMFGIDSFSAVINPPQSAILAVGSLKPRPVVDDGGTIVARPTLQLTLACDHRILYGADGARFLSRIRDLLQAPLGMLI